MAKGQGYWVPADIEDETIRFTFEAHKPIKLKGTPWLYCKHCGLQYLKNKQTKWCIKMGCNHAYHKDYRRILYGNNTR